MSSMQPPGEPPRIGLHQLLRVMAKRALRTCTSPTAHRRSCGSTAPWFRSRFRRCTPIDTKQLCYSVLTEEQKVTFEKKNELDLSFGVKNLARFRANIFTQRGAVAGAFRAIPFKCARLRRARAAPDNRGHREPRARTRAGHGPDGLGQVHDAGRDDRQDQQRDASAHHHHRRSDRVPAPAQAVAGEPARGRHRHRTRSRTRCAPCCVRIRTSC